MTAKRELWADYSKGICILLVYIGHLDFISPFLRTFIYLFHMPMFFFCMGSYCNTNLNFKKYIIKKARQLLMPYFVVSICDNVILRTIVIPTGGGKLEIAKAMIGILIQVRGTEYIAPYWFLTASFVASMLYWILRHLIRNIKFELLITCAISYAFIYLFNITGIALPWHIDEAFPCLIYIYIGYIIRKKQCRIGKKGIAILFVSGAICSLVICHINRFTEDLYFVDYHALKLLPFSLILAGGIQLCLALYGLLSKIKVESIISYIGKNSLLYYLFDWIPSSIIAKVCGILPCFNSSVMRLFQFAGFFLLMPFFVMFLKYFFWPVLGLEKETWSLDYRNAVRCKQCKKNEE